MPKDLILLLLCAALAAGEAAGFAAARFGACWPLAAFAATLVSLFGHGWRVRGWPAAAVFLFGLARALAVSAERDTVLDGAWARPEGGPCSVEAVVSAPPRVRSVAGGSERLSVPAAIGPVEIRVVLSLPSGSARPRAGERWLFAGWLSRDPLPDRDIRMFWVKGPGASARRLPDTPAGRLASVVRGWRGNLSRRAGIGLAHDPRSAALNRAILLGGRAALEPSVREDFVSAGTIHVFAISGLHVMFIAHLLRLALVVCGVPLRAGGAVAIPLVWLYAWLTGFAPSAVRAATMSTFHFSAPVFWRRPDGVVSWALTFLLVHAVSPARLFDVGCRLSFTVMLAIVAWLRWGSRSGSRRGGAFALTVAAWAAGVPIVARVFGRFTPGGLLANPVVIPLAGAGMTAGALGLLASFVSDGLAAHLNNFAALCTRAMASVSSFVAGLPGASVDVAPWTPAMCAGWYAACVLAVRLARERARRTAETGWLADSAAARFRRAVSSGRLLLAAIFGILSPINNKETET